MTNTIGRGRSLIIGSVVAASPGGGSNAQDTVSRLTGQDYSVTLNHNGGWSDVTLSECIVNGIHGLASGVPQGRPLPPEQQGALTVYVDVGCSTTE